MGIFFRVSDLITANLNGLLDRVENPDVMLAQVIREMEASLGRARQYAAVAIAAERMLRRELDEQRLQADRWKSRALGALSANRDHLARRALAQKLEHESWARSLEQQHAEAVQTRESARNALHALETRLSEARHKQQILLARHRSAQVRVSVHRHMGAGYIHYGASQIRLDKLENRLNQRIDELAAEADLNEALSLEAEFTDLECQQAINRELEALRNRTG